MSSDNLESPKNTQRRKTLIGATAVVAAICAVGGSLYAAFVPGLSIAHQEPPAAEVVIATWLLHQSVPDETKRAVNPLKDDLASVAAGRDLYREKCEPCHAYDGGGKT